MSILERARAKLRDIDFIAEIADKIHRGEPIGIIVARDVGKKPRILKILQKLAGKYIDEGDPVRASIALNEAKKLTSGEYDDRETS